LILPYAVFAGLILVLSGVLVYRQGLEGGRESGAAGLGRLVMTLGIALGILLLATFALALSLRRKYVAPVYRMVQAAEALAEGQWQRNLELAGDPGPRQLAARLNAVAARAHRLMNEAERQRIDLTSLVDSLPDPILLTDPQQRVVLINAPAARFLSLTPQVAVGQKLISVLSESSLVDLYEHLSEAPTQDHHWHEIRVHRGGAKLTYQAAATRTPGGGVLVVLRDVTTLAAAVQMKTDFVANASHELRTPVAAIKLAMETLSEVYLDDSAQAGRCIEIIEGHQKRLEDLLSDLLDLSRVESVELKPLRQPLSAENVLAVIGRALGDLAADKGVSLLTDAAPSLNFRSDRRLLDLIIKNLAENAIKYTPVGGQVMVRLFQETEADAERIVLQVIDSGIGIPPQHLERVFERFYQVDAARSGGGGRGTGLGLAIVKHAVHALNGHVALASTVGQGTTVTCTFDVEPE
jgi:two-component system phosphate regulon sensor histidine kinase PhoR